VAARDRLAQRVMTCRAARAAHDGISTGRAQAATELVCRRVARDGH
jgi:hypothetical protein